MLGNTYGAALLAVGRPRAAAAGWLAKVVGIAVLVPLGFYVAEARQAGLGFFGAVLGFAASELMRYAASLVACRALAPTSVRSDVWLTLMVTGISSLGALFEWWLRDTGVNVVLRSLLIATVVTLAWLPVGGPMLSERLAQRRARRAQHDASAGS